jgi:hypothetical protein
MNALLALAAAAFLTASPRASGRPDDLAQALLDAVIAADLGALVDAGADAETCPGAPLCPLVPSPIAAMPHLELAVIRLDATGRARDAAEVIFDPDAPRGIALALGPDLAPRGLRLRRWSLERREAPERAGPFTDADDLVSRSARQGRDFMAPYPASLFKLLVAFHLARRSAEGGLSLDEWIPETLSPDASSRPAEEWLDRMMTVSDNAATKALLRWMHGLGEVDRMNRDLAALGLATLRVGGTRPEDGARWVPGEIHAGAMDVARLLWLVAGGPGVRWRTAAGRVVTSADLPEPARALLTRLLSDQASHDILSSGSLCGAEPFGIPALVPERWIDPATGNEAGANPLFRRDVRPCNEKAEVRFLHKTGLTWNYVADAGLVESLPGAPCRRYVIALVASAGTRYLDPERGVATLHPCALDGHCVTRRLAAIAARIDRWMVGASAGDRTGAGCATRSHP